MSDLRIDGPGYNPNRASNGRFGSGAHAKPKAKPKAAPKFNAAPHERRIAKHKADELKHRQASLAIKAKMAALKKTARATTPKQRAALKERFHRMAARRDALKAKATEAKNKRVEAGKGLQTARKEHVAKQRAAREKQRGPTKKAAPVKQSPHEERKRAESPRPAVTPTPHPAPPKPEPPVPTAPTKTLEQKLNDIGRPTSDLGNEAAAAAHMKDAHAYLAQGELTKAKSSMDQALVAHGFAQHFETRGAEMRVERNGELGPNADGHRKWDGTIVLRQSVAGRLEYHGQRQSQGAKGTGPEHEAMQVAIHESMHGHGPTGKYQYVGVHAKIEEVTTETVARKLANHYYGADKGQGAYGLWISYTKNVIAEHHNVSHERAGQILEETSIKFKKERPGGREMPLDVFARHLGPGKFSREQLFDRMKSDPVLGKESSP